MFMLYVQQRGITAIPDAYPANLRTWPFRQQAGGRYQYPEQYIRDANKDMLMKGKGSLVALLAEMHQSDDLRPEVAETNMEGLLEYTQENGPEVAICPSQSVLAAYNIIMADD